MNLGMFFEGTGQGVAGKLTNVTRLRDLCVDSHDEASNLWGAFNRVRRNLSGIRLHRLCRGFEGRDRKTASLGTMEEFKKGKAK